MLSGNTLSSSSRRLFPLLNPTVGRAVGAYFQYQENEKQPQALQLTGTLEDGDQSTPDQVRLSLTRAKDGVVEVTGDYAGHPVEVNIGRVMKQGFREKNNLIWGQAGSETLQSRAEMSGAVGEYPLDAWITTRRQEIDVEMSPQVERAGKAIYTLPFKFSVTPTFGGAPARVNGLPGHVPTASSPLQTQDFTKVQARLGDLETVIDQNWTTTTWTVSTNHRDGGSRVTMYQHEKAAESEKWTQQGEQRQESREYEVEPGRTAMSEDREYDLNFSAGIVSGSLQEGEESLKFELKPQK